MSFVGHHLYFLVILSLGGAFGLLLAVPIIAPSLLEYFPNVVRPLLAAPEKTPINVLIFWTTFLGGMATAALASARVHREMLILGASREKIETAKEQWARDSRLSWSLDDGLAAVLPTGASAIEEPRQSTTGRMVAAIQADARDLRFDPIPVVVERVINDLDSGSNAVRIWQGYAVRLGILFTFVGLVIALAPVRDILASAPGGSADDLQSAIEGFTALRSSIGNVVSGLALAFGSSIVGLLSALCLQLAAGMVQRRESDAIEMLGSVAADVQYVFRRARNETPLAKDIESLRTLLAQHKDELHASSRAINADVAALDARLEGIARARDSVSALLERESEAADRQSKLVAELSSAEARLIEIVKGCESGLSEIVMRSGLSLNEVIDASSSRFSDMMAKVIADVQKRYVDGSKALISAISEMGGSLAREISEGYGREARVALERQVADALQRSADALMDREQRHAVAAEKIARNLAYSFCFGVIVLFAAGAVAVMVQFGYFR